MIKKGKVRFNDFGKITNDTENRDERLKAYICAIFDVSEIQFEDIIKDINSEKKMEAFIDMINDDANGRIKKILREYECNL